MNKILELQLRDTLNNMLSIVDDTTMTDRTKRLLIVSWTKEFNKIVEELNK